MLHNKQGEWLTVREASIITGKSIDAIRMLLHRKKLSNVKKVNSVASEGKRSQWLIHRDTVNLLHNSSMTDKAQVVMNNEPITMSHNSNVIPLEYFDSKQKEWIEERDKLQTGLIMYRFKFEEAEKQLKLLPAPVETVTLKLEELERKLQEKEAALGEQSARLQEEQKSRARIEVELQRERSLPWWRKLFKNNK